MTGVSFNALAERELLEAIDYYEDQTLGLGQRFLDEVEAATRFLLDYPRAGQAVRGSIRRFVLPKFPYSLLYRALWKNRIRILAVAHHKRRPRYWLDRH